MSGHESANPMVTDVFVKGAVQGWNIAVTSTIPNVLMAFVIIKVLNHSGLLTIFGELFAPIMAIFGLPGEAAAFLLGGWMSMGGGVGVAVSLFDQGLLTGEHVAIGKTTAVGSIQPNIARAPPLRHAHKRAYIGLVPIEQ